MTISSETPRGFGDDDAPHWSGVTPAEDARTVMINRVSWAAVLAGVAVALVTQALLNMLGVGLGAAVLDPATGDNPGAAAFSMTAAAWWVGSGVLAAFAGGVVAGRLSGRPKRSTASWHGLIAWAATTLVLFCLLASAAGGIIGGTMNAVGHALGGLGKAAGSGVAAVAPALAQANDPLGQIERQVRDATGGNDPAALRDAAVSAVRAAIGGDPAQATDARERAAQALVRAQAGTDTPITVEDARARVGEYEKQYQAAVERTKQQAREAAETATKVVSRASLLAFVALVLGAIAGWFGGALGTVEPTITATTRRTRHA